MTSGTDKAMEKSEEAEDNADGSKSPVPSSTDQAGAQGTGQPGQEQAGTSTQEQTEEEDTGSGLNCGILTLALIFGSCLFVFKVYKHI